MKKGTPSGHPPMGHSSNPYKRRVHDYPGRLFSFNNFDRERESVRTLSAGEVFCEIGSGSGGHLIERALIAPESVFFGFELRYKRAVRTVEKAILRGADNLFLLRTNVSVITQLFEPGSVSGIYVNFPDPWLKPKQEKHRLLSRWLLDVSAQLLVVGGFLSVKTDHLPSYQQFLRFVEERPEFEVSEETGDFYQSPYLAGNISSEFERLFVSQQLPVCYLKLICRRAMTTERGTGQIRAMVDRERGFDLYSSTSTSTSTST